MATLSTKDMNSLLAQHSPFWVRQLQAHPDDAPWLQKSGSLEEARSVRGLQSIWHSTDWPKLSVAETFSALRALKRREMLRITVRDLANIALLAETVGELSALADFCLQRGLGAALRDMIARNGEPHAQFAIFGMGKLGGQELNYSSDIDLIFAYSDEGTVGKLSHHDFFTRVVESVIKGFRESDDNGSLFRVDLRLRPEGNSGPVTRSLESYENYYAAFGEVWERMALQKTRCCAGDAELGYEFIQHLQPFCFPKHLSVSSLDEIFRIKGRIEAEILKDGGLERHVKLGRGGVREIEFTVQALQLLHGARHAFSQESGTLKALKALQRLDLLAASDSLALTKAYVFLRRVEHRLQMREDRQTHVVPADRAYQTELARGLGYASHDEFDAEWKVHVQFVRSFFEKILCGKNGDTSIETPIPDWSAPSTERDDVLKKLGFEQVERAASTMQILAYGPDYAHVSERTRELFKRLYPDVFRILPTLARPDFVLQQFERFIGSYGSRAALYELLVSNTKMLELLFKLFDHSRFLTDVIVHQPAFLEAIAFEGLLGLVPDRKQMETLFSKETAESPESRLRLFKRAELLRIELRDILGLEPSIEATSNQISQLAEVCLAQAVKIASSEKGGRNKSGAKGDSGLCLIGMGKFGTHELSYGSDLDVLFIGGAPEVASRVIALMSQEREEGIVFKVDARLRPDGEDGPLTLPLEAYVRYYQKRAQFWEKQSLTRARVVAGDPHLGKAFMKMVAKILYERPLRDEERKEIKAMRLRIEQERGDSADPAREFKTGAGGLVDVEFLVQAQQLLHGHAHLELRHGSISKILRAMPKVAGWKAPQVEALIEDYSWLRRLESALRRFHNAPVSQLPESRADWKPLARHLGIASPAALEKELSERRKRIRAFYTSHI